MNLPGTAGPRLAVAVDTMDDRTREVFLTHLFSDTSAEYLASWHTRSGTPVSASTIRTYRRSLHPSGRRNDER
jgi:hypothetical protein